MVICFHSRNYYCRDSVMLKHLSYGSHLQFPCGTVTSRNYENRWHWRFPWTSGFCCRSKYALWLLTVVVWTLIFRLCGGDICQMTYVMWHEHFFFSLELALILIYVMFCCVIFVPLNFIIFRVIQFVLMNLSRKRWHCVKILLCSVVSMKTSRLLLWRNKVHICRLEKLYRR